MITAARQARGRADGGDEAAKPVPLELVGVITRGQAGEHRFGERSQRSRLPGLKHRTSAPPAESGQT